MIDPRFDTVKMNPACKVMLSSAERYTSLPAEHYQQLPGELIRINAEAEKLLTLEGSTPQECANRCAKSAYYGNNLDANEYINWDMQSPKLSDGELPYMVYHHPYGNPSTMDGEELTHYCKKACDDFPACEGIFVNTIDGRCSLLWPQTAKASVDDYPADFVWERSTNKGAGGWTLYTGEALNPSAGSCPSGWTCSGAFAYLFIDVEEKAADAIAACATHKATLATIPDQAAWDVYGVTIRMSHRTWEGNSLTGWRISLQCATS